MRKKIIMKIKVSSQKKVPNWTDGIGARRWIVETHPSLYVNFLLVWTVRYSTLCNCATLEIITKSALVAIRSVYGPIVILSSGTALFCADNKSNRIAQLLLSQRWCANNNQQLSIQSNWLKVFETACLCYYVFK